ncbi:SHOCT-like domain-containing protein [Vulgatibacter incomptus]|uniref:YvlB/LiaX N-terminal domain-containing protein n=1 Tax=Vulgatibacter incomptus TaxID=1391653 RepID=A0A0K1PHU6_9BACT|nr:YIP1 family protein [Vulgatibacter incomptus]AKU92684.1 hypothetical protein AKJ08_3071 [Vulgatibacter incomptus]
MNAPRLRILEMLAAGQINPTEAEQLLEAIRAPRGSVWTWLFRPIERLETGVALGAASVGAGLQLLVARLLEIRFDGVLDIHLAKPPVTWSVALVDLALGWPLTALVFVAAARLFARQVRIVDALALVGIARIPLVAAGALVGALHGASRGADSAANLGTLVLFAWSVALLVTGLGAASGLRGGKLALAVIAAIAVAEAIAKGLLVAL